MAETETTDDAFYGGRLLLRQPRRGYRAGMDALVLAAGAASLGFDTALDLGCGVGAALLGSALLQPGARLTGVEKDPVAAALARHNVEANGLKEYVRVVQADGLSSWPEQAGMFDLVFSNPPFFDDLSAIRPPAPERSGAWVAGVPLAVWIKAMVKLAAPKGQLLILHRADRLGDILAALPGRAGDVRVYPLRPRCAAPASRVLVAARKGSRAPLSLLKGLDLHPPSSEEGRFTHAMQAVLEGAPLPGFGGQAERTSG